MVPDSLTKLINSFKLLPGIGEKTAERLAYAVLNLEKDQVDYFAKSLNDSFSLIHRCPICNSLTDLEILEDMIMVAFNNAFNKVDQLREKKMSKYSNMMPGMF